MHARASVRTAPFYHAQGQVKGCIYMNKIAALAAVCVAYVVDFS